MIVVTVHLAGLSDPEEEAYPFPSAGWLCFHCGQRFGTYRGARLHFGPTPDGVARCVATDA